MSKELYHVLAVPSFVYAKLKPQVVVSFEIAYCGLIF